jgi:hypothetical protein
MLLSLPLECDCLFVFEGFNVLMLSDGFLNFNNFLQLILSDSYFAWFKWVLKVFNNKSYKNRFFIEFRAVAIVSDEISL